MTIFILGAGPAGLALANGLADIPDVRVVLIDADKQVGGLARTLRWANYGSHDLGPHKLFTINPELERRVVALLPENEWIHQTKRSRIFMNGHYLPYPPSPFSLVNVFGPVTFAGMVMGFFSAKVKSLFKSPSQETFESELVSRIGRPLYRVLFEPIALKLWGEPAQLDPKLSQGRVQTPSLLQLILKTLGFLKATQTSEALSFRYPRGGLQKLWDSIVRSHPNLDLRLETRVTGLEISDRRITTIVTKTGSESEQRVDVGPDDFVFSSLPLGRLPTLFGNVVPATLKQRIDEFVMLNDLVLVFLKIKAERLTPDSWIFIPDPKLPFHRLSEQAAFDPAMTPDGSIVCCEIMSRPGRSFTDKTDAELRKLCVDGLTSMGFATEGNEAWDARVVRLPASYPVYRPQSTEALGEIIQFFDAFENFRTIGRQGSFNYIGSLDAMDVGYGAAAWLKKRRTVSKTVDWKEERLRTSHYPVLD